MNALLKSVKPEMEEVCIEMIFCFRKNFPF
jgi:hypothetical protein